MQPFFTRRVRVQVDAHDSDPLPPPAPLGRVLFVTGDDDLRAVVTRVLQREGYCVTTVAHSGHALLHCRRAPYDVLVAELSGPDVSGPTLLDQARRHCPEIAAVYLCNPGTPDGLDHLLVRPFTRDELLDRIHSAACGVPA